MRAFLFLFLLFPFIELALLIQVGSAIGVLPTLLLVIGTGILGAILLSRLNTRHTPTTPKQLTPAQVAAIGRGGYVLIDSEGAPELVLIATGSEVGLAAEAAKLLTAQGRRVRVVANFGVGVNHIDLDAARAAGVMAGAMATSTNCLLALMASTTSASMGRLKAMMPPKALVGSVWKALL